MKKELWSPVEDEKLKQYILKHGYHSWSEVSIKTGLQRGGKSCRLRWINYLRPGLKKCKFSCEEIKLVMDLHKIYGNRWSKIARYMEGRTDNDVKNICNSEIRRQDQTRLNNNWNHKSTLPNISLVHSINFANPSKYCFTLEKKEEQEHISTNHKVKNIQPRNFPFKLDSIEINVANIYGINGQHQLHPLEHPVENFSFSNLNLTSMYNVALIKNSHIKSTPFLEDDQESIMAHLTTLDNITVKRIDSSCESHNLTSTNEDHNGEDDVLDYMLDSWTRCNNQDQLKSLTGHSGILMKENMQNDDNIATIYSSHSKVPPLTLPRFNPASLVSPIFDPIKQHDFEVSNSSNFIT